MKIIWSEDGKTVIMGLDKIIQIYIREVRRDKEDESKGKRYLIRAFTSLFDRCDDGIFLKEFNTLEEAQNYIVWLVDLS